MKFHHIGIATNDIMTSIETIKKIFDIKTVTDIIFDEIQDVNVCMLTTNNNENIELIEGKKVEKEVKIDVANSLPSDQISKEKNKLEQALKLTELLSNEQKKDIKEFINKWEFNFREGLSENQREFADKIAEYLKYKLINFSRVYRAIDQCDFIKEFIDLILLAFLDVDCILTNENRFETNLSIKKVETDDFNHENISFKSQDYLKKFIY